MSDMTDQREVRAGVEEIAAHALRQVARDDAETPVPGRIEAAVMRAWDAGNEGAAHSRYRVRPAWAALAAAACGVLIAALWLTDARNATPTIAETPALSPADLALAADASSLESIAPIDVLLQEDPASLRLVRVSVQASVLATLGDPLADPTETQPIDIEMLIGLDGVPRTVRRVSTILNRE